MSDETRPAAGIIALPEDNVIDGDFVYLNHVQEVRLWGKKYEITHPVFRPGQNVINRVDVMMRSLDDGIGVNFGSINLRKPGIVNSLRAISLTAEGNLDYNFPTFTRRLSPGPIFYYATSFIGTADTVKKFRYSSGQIRVYRFVRRDRGGKVVEVGFMPILEGKENYKAEKPNFNAEDFRLLKRVFGTRDKAVVSAPAVYTQSVPKKA